MCLLSLLKSDNVFYASVLVLSAAIRMADYFPGKRKMFLTRQHVCYVAELLVLQKKTGGV
jgi:hypothetical protein